MSSQGFNSATVLRDLPDELRRLALNINTLQTRMGTANEEPGDLQKIQEATHKYMNQLTEYFTARHMSTPPFVTAYNQNRTEQ